MGKQIQFDYYYGIEAEQFSFYRVPRLLIKDERFKGLSSDAKLLYGLMLDRMSLSMKNGWLDEENRAYIIYTLDTVMEDLGCAKATCVKIMKELDSDNGIGLIEKKRRGLGKPDIIYVKNFATIGEAEEETPAKADGGKSYLTKFSEILEEEPLDMVYPEYYTEILDNEDDEDFYNPNTVFQWFKIEMILELNDNDANNLVISKSDKKVNEVIGTTRTAVMFIKNSTDITV